jgi:hAT family C-terminal dimerisation region
MNYKIFLGASVLDEVDILDYWRRNANIFPTLAMMARDIFAVPMSTVPFESYFSSANRILTDKRIKLGPTVFERLVCLKDWIDAENRMQYKIEAATFSAETQVVPVQRRIMIRTMKAIFKITTYDI